MPELGTRPLLDKGQCVVCFDETSDKMPCKNCRACFCCEGCIEKTITTSSESCRTGKCFLCRDKNLDVVIPVITRPALLRPRPESVIQVRNNSENCKTYLKRVIAILLFIAFMYIAGATARWLNYNDDKSFLYYLRGSGTLSSTFSTIMDNYLSGIIVIVIVGFLYVVFGNTRSVLSGNVQYNSNS